MEEVGWAQPLVRVLIFPALSQAVILRATPLAEMCVIFLHIP